MTQQMIDQLDAQEYSSFLAYGETCDSVFPTQLINKFDCEWISTLESTTYHDMTYGDIDQL